VQRWEEQQRCRSGATQTSAAMAQEIAAICLAQVTRRRLARLGDGLPPAGAGAATTAATNAAVAGR
jgi:hypothetical protein